MPAWVWGGLILILAGLSGASFGSPLLLPYPEDSTQIDIEKTDREVFAD